jgi:hypothetical protein
MIQRTQTPIDHGPIMPARNQRIKRQVARNRITDPHLGVVLTQTPMVIHQRRRIHQHRRIHRHRVIKDHQIANEGHARKVDIMDHVLRVALVRVGQVHALRGALTPGALAHALRGALTPGAPVHALTGALTPGAPVHVLREALTPGAPAHVLREALTPGAPAHALREALTPGALAHVLREALTPGALAHVRRGVLPTAIPDHGIPMDHSVAAIWVVAPIAALVVTDLALAAPLEQVQVPHPLAPVGQAQSSIAATTARIVEIIAMSVANAQSGVQYAMEASHSAIATNHNNVQEAIVLPAIALAKTIIHVRKSAVRHR